MSVSFFISRNFIYEKYVDVIHMWNRQAHFYRFLILNLSFKLPTIDSPVGEISLRSVTSWIGGWFTPFAVMDLQEKNWNRRMNRSLSLLRLVYPPSQTSWLTESYIMNARVIHRDYMRVIHHDWMSRTLGLTQS